MEGMNKERKEIWMDGREDKTKDVRNEGRNSYKKIVCIQCDAT